jgi:hypothetical protein
LNYIRYDQLSVKSRPVAEKEMKKCQTCNCQTEQCHSGSDPTIPPDQQYGGDSNADIVCYPEANQQCIGAVNHPRIYNQGEANRHDRCDHQQSLNGQLPSTITSVDRLFRAHDLLYEPQARIQQRNMDPE